MKKFIALLTLMAVISGLALAQAAPAKLREFTDIVSAVDVVGNTVTVKKLKAEETFNVTSDTKIKLRKEYKLAELPKDSKVFIKYKEDAGAKVAVSILIQKLGKPVKPVK